jgi:hypothetical protein
MQAPREQPTDDHRVKPPTDEVAAALGQVVAGYRTRLRGDVSSIRALIRRGRIEEALEALEQQRRSLQVAAACLDGVMAEATAQQPRRPTSRRAGPAGPTLVIGAFLR